MLDWFKSTDARHLAVQLDLNVLDPALVGAVLFAQSNASLGAFDGVAQGELSVGAVVRLLNELAQHADIVGLGIAEYLPWAALALRDMLARPPLFAPQVLEQAPGAGN